MTLLVATQRPTQEALGGGALRAQLTHNLRRVYQAAVAAAGEDLAHLDLRGPMTCGTRSQRGWRTPASPRG